jgi:hypothetical protein
MEQARCAYLNTGVMLIRMQRRLVPDGMLTTRRKARAVGDAGMGHNTLTQDYYAADVRQSTSIQWVKQSTSSFCPE